MLKVSSGSTPHCQAASPSSVGCARDPGKLVRVHLCQLGSASKCARVAFKRSSDLETGKCAALAESCTSCSNPKQFDFPVRAQFQCACSGMDARSSTMFSFGFGAAGLRSLVVLSARTPFHLVANDQFVVCQVG